MIITLPLSAALGITDVEVSALEGRWVAVLISGQSITGVIKEAWPVGDGLHITFCVDVREFQNFENICRCTFLGIGMPEHERTALCLPQGRWSHHGLG